MPRIARIKLSGGLSGDDVQVTGKSLIVGLAGMVLFLGAGIAGAAWLGSSLFDAREAVARTADSAAASIGFEIENIEVAGVSGARAQEVRAVIVPDGRRSVLSLDPIDVKARVERLDWVQSAQVRRLWPSTLVVEVERRRAYALWRDDGELSVIDSNGQRLTAESVADHQGLPLVVGANAGPAARPLLVALENLPNVRARLKQIVRVNNRRWNVELASGAIVVLPEEGAELALARLETLHAEHALLDRPVAALDMRAPGRLAVRVHPELAGGRYPMLGGV
jgi:cell division protein FtsQ